VTFKTLLGLVITNLIWSAHPAMGKLVLESFSPAHGAWLRYFSALLVYLIVALCWQRGSKRPVFFMVPEQKADWGWIVALGFAAFCFSPFLQMSGLSMTRAIDNALIVALEPLFSVFIAWIILKEGLRAYHWVTLGLAMCGFALLAGLGSEHIFKGWDTHLWGNFILLISLTGEACYSVMGRKLVSRYSPASVFGTSLVLGVSFLFMLTVLTGGGLGWGEFCRQLTWRSALGILWLGPLGTTFSYLLWMIALVEAPVASVAVTLFIQPFMGSVWGYVVLRERVSMSQGVGGVLILLAVFGPLMFQHARRVSKRWSRLPQVYG
jgi:drug/metabolite transporter (DMT)-like permease